MEGGKNPGAEDLEESGDQAEWNGGQKEKPPARREKGRSLHAAREWHSPHDVRVPQRKPAAQDLRAQELPPRQELEHLIGEESVAALAREQRRPGRHAPEIA